MVDQCGGELLPGHGQRDRAPEVFQFQRHDRGLSTRQITAALRELARRTLG